MGVWITAFMDTSNERRSIRQVPPADELRRNPVGPALAVWVGNPYSATAHTDAEASLRSTPQ